MPSFEQVKTHMYDVNIKHSNVTLKKNIGAALITKDQFTYKRGDLDFFKIRIYFPENFGIYHYWLTFRYRSIDQNINKYYHYRSKYFKNEICTSVTSIRLDENDSILYKINEVY